MTGIWEGKLWYGAKAQTAMEEITTAFDFNTASILTTNEFEKLSNNAKKIVVVIDDCFEEEEGGGETVPTKAKIWELAKKSPFATKRFFDRLRETDGYKLDRLLASLMCAKVWFPEEFKKQQ